MYLVKVSDNGLESSAEAYNEKNEVYEFLIKELSKRRVVYNVYNLFGYGSFPDEVIERANALVECTGIEFSLTETKNNSLENLVSVNVENTEGVYDTFIMTRGDAQTFRKEYEGREGLKILVQSVEATTIGEVLELPVMADFTE